MNFMQLKIREIKEKDYEEAAYIKSMAFYIDKNKNDNVETIINSFYALKNMKQSKVFVCCCEEEIVGLITIHEFTMNFHERFIDVYALSGVAVHIRHRMQGVADFMIHFFLKHAKSNGASMVMLYPYKPSFYKKYGFGWGIEKYEYSFKSDNFKYKNNKNIFQFEPNSMESIKKIDNEYVKMQHGMCFIGEYEWYKLTQEITDDDIVMIRNDDGNLEGYAIVKYEKDGEYNPYDQTIIIEKLVTLSPRAKEHFFSYLFTLKDQFETVKIYTHEQFFYYNLKNAGSIYDATVSTGYHYNCRQGLGIMYKAINPQNLLNLLYCRDIKTGYCFIIKDKYNNSIEEVYLHDKNTKNKIYINVEDFTSWIMGCIPMVDLYKLGLIDTQYQIADKLDDEIRLKRPICTSIF